MRARSAADSLLAIDTVGAGTSVLNSGRILGFIDLTDAADNVENLDDGLFDARLISDFGDGDDVFDNSGTIRAAVDPAVLEAAAFINLETFNNGSLTGGPGLITMVDGQAGDSFTLGDGDDNFVYTGQGFSTLAVDAFEPARCERSTTTLTSQHPATAMSPVIASPPP